MRAESFKEKDALRRAHLRALAAALRLNPKARGQAAALAAPLGKLVLEGCVKAAARLDGLLALTAAAYIAAADLKADEALAGDKVRARGCVWWAGHPVLQRHRKCLKRAGGGHRSAIRWTGLFPCKVAWYGV